MEREHLTHRQERLKSSQTIVELQALFDGSDQDTRFAILDAVLQVCTGTEIQFLRRVVARRTPISSDPVVALGRQNAIRVFSFLDPRSLHRCARVCWGWRDVALLDAIWRTKCLLRGWPIPYTPTKFEIGAWRSWYVQCMGKIQALAQEARIAAENSVEAALDALKQARKAEVRAFVPHPDVDNGRDIGDSDSVTSDAPDRDMIPPEHRVLLRHTRECELRLLSLLQLNGLEQYNDVHMVRPCTLGEESPRKSAHQNVDGVHDPRSSVRRLRTEHRLMEATHAIEAIEAVMRRRIEETKSQRQKAKLQEEMAVPRVAGASLRTLDAIPGSTRGNVSILEEKERREAAEMQAFVHNTENEMGDSTVPPGMADDRHPRLILVSSETSARVLLLNAVRFDVASLPYNANGTVADVLLRRVALLLRGRKAKSIGIVCPGRPGQFSVSVDLTVSLRALVKAEGKHDDDFAPSISPIKFWSELAGHIVEKEKGGSIHIFAGGVADTVSGVEVLEAIRQITGLEVVCPRPPLRKNARYAWCWDSLSLGAGTSDTRLYFIDTALNTWVHTQSSIAGVVEDVKRTVAVALPKTYTSLSLHLVGELVENVLFDRSWIEESPHLQSDLEDAIAAVLKKAPKNPSLFVADFLIQRQTHRERDSVKDNDSPAMAAAVENDAELWLPVDEQQTIDLATSTKLLCTLSDLDILVRSEEQFVAKLRTLKTMYAEPIRVLLASVRAVNGDPRLSKRPMTTISYRKIFTDPLSVLAVHEKLLEDLHRVEDGRHDTRGGAACLAEIAREEHVYRNYVAGLGTILQTIVECYEESPIFRAFLTRTRVQCDGLSLMELVQLPLSRLPFYTRVIERELVSGSVSTAVERLQQIHKVIAGFEKHMADWNRRSVLKAYAERTIGPLPLPKGSAPLHPQDFVTESHFIQVERKNEGMAEFHILQDVEVFLFRKEIIIMTALKYFDSLKQDTKLHRSLLVRLQLVEVLITLGKDLAGSLHTIEIHPKGVRHGPIYLGSPTRTHQLEFYEAVKAIETVDVVKRRANTSGGKMR